MVLVWITGHANDIGRNIYNEMSGEERIYRMK
jgi:hypothetical protein